jgi:hypothetical protein
MSRLHESLINGAGENMEKLYLKATISPRAGTRTKTKRKTARAMGTEFVDTRPWRVRNSGIISAKSAKVKQQTKMKKFISEKAKGDTKAM